MQPSRRLHTRILAATVVVSHLLQPLVVAAASTDLTDVPLAVQTGAKPNILFVLDNSGSMAWETITGTDALGEYNSGKDRAAHYSPSFNKLYYNPAITYLPGAKYDGSATGGTSSMGNSPTNAARIDAYPTSSGETGVVDVAMSCWNTSGWLTLPIYGYNTFTAYTTNCDSKYSTGKPVEYARYAFYYRWKGVGTESGTSGQSSATYYDRVDILPANAPFPKAGTRTDCAGSSSCTYAEEIQNFANWFSYYRTRILTAKTTLGLAFSVLDEKSRVGLTTINASGSTGNASADNFVALSDFDKTQKQSWYSTLYGINPSGGTPLLDALKRAGEYYRTGSMEGEATKSDPVTLACTPNYTILSTDGYWNSNKTGTNYEKNPKIGDRDTTVPALPANVYVDPDSGLPVNDPLAGAPLVTGQAFPLPFYDGVVTTSGTTLADVAMYYWITDLRAPSGGKVVSNRFDPATWQHMTTYTIGLGAPGTVTQLPAGSDRWPSPIPNEDSTRIDDLWHAAINGHGQYFNTGDPLVLQNALSSILNDILNRTAAAAAVAVSNPNVRSGDNTAFASNYNSGAWYGDLEAFSIDLQTGQLSAAPVWSSQAALDAKTVADRRIGSFSGTAGVAFAAGAGGLDSAQLARLNSPTSPPGPGDHAAVIDYLRGDRTKEGDGSDATRPYRTRVHLLGDIVDAEAVYVTPPRGSYSDTGYAAFKSGPAAARAKIVYQGANDGMLHAFDAATGGELWAYVPGLLVDTNLSPTETSTSALVGLTQQPLHYQHRYFVNGTPISGDVDLSNTSANQPTPPTPDWATVLVGSLGKGGRGYYALNITDPSATSDADVGAKVLWEFPNASTPAAIRQNIGFSYGTPVLVKTRAAGWVALVTSGYNNGADTGGDGQGHLWVLDVRTGAVLADLATGQGGSATPSGLARISAFVTRPGIDDTVESVYGGDLLGNVWRFDLSDAAIGNWNVKRLATLVDKDNGAPQPVTMAPELGIVDGKRMVYVGTGQYLGADDIPDSPSANASSKQRQSFYGLYDDLTGTPTIAPLRTNLVAQTPVAAGGNINVTTNPVDLAVKKGWVLDFASTNGERSYTNAVLSQGVLAFTTNTPSNDPCLPGGSSNLYFLHYATGGAVPNLTSRYIGPVLSSRPQLIVLASGVTKTIIRTSDNKTRVIDVSVPSATSATRIMWREVVQD